MEVDARVMLRNCLALHAIFWNCKPHLSLFSNKSPRGISKYTPIFPFFFSKIPWIQINTREREFSFWISSSYITQWWSVTLFRQTSKYTATKVVCKVQGRAMCCYWEREIAVWSHELACMLPWFYLLLKEPEKGIKWGLEYLPQGIRWEQ